MISKILLDSDKKYFMKNQKVKMVLQRLQQTEKQLEMLLTKRNLQITELFSVIK
jgi:hypothetical protein